MKKDYKVYLDDILESIDLIEEYSQRETIQSFRENKEKQDAVIRRFSVIGEAANRLPAEFKDRYVNIPWHEVIGLRNIVVHEYSGINLDRVWNTIKKDLPPLKEFIEGLIYSKEEAE